MIICIFQVNLVMVNIVQNNNTKLTIRKAVNLFGMYHLGTVWHILDIVYR